MANFSQLTRKRMDPGKLIELLVDWVLVPLVMAVIWLFRKVFVMEQTVDGNAAKIDQIKEMVDTHNKNLEHHNDQVIDRLQSIEEHLRND